MFGVLSSSPCKSPTVRLLELIVPRHPGNSFSSPSMSFASWLNTLSPSPPSCLALARHESSLALLVSTPSASRRRKPRASLRSLLLRRLGRRLFPKALEKKRLRRLFALSSQCPTGVFPAFVALMSFGLAKERYSQVETISILGFVLIGFFVVFAGRVPGITPCSI